MKDFTDLKVIEYELLFDEESLRSVALQLRRRRGCESWLINRVGETLYKIPDDHGCFKFKYEPWLSSSHDDDYYHDYCFNSAEGAYEFWKENRGKILATYDEEIEFVRMTRGISHI